jgi:hypothetical protein
MTVTREELLQDLTYARTLAEEGRRAPLIGGAYLVLFGVLLTIAYGAHGAMLLGQVEQQWAGAIWMAFGVCAGLGVFLLRGRTKDLPGSSSISNRADRTVWHGVSWAILFVVAGALARGIFYDDYIATFGIMAAGFGLYGVALYSTATLSGHMWLRTFAWLSWALSATMWLFLGEPWAYLMGAVGAFLVLLVPGVIMMRAEPSKVV